MNELTSLLFPEPYVAPPPVDDGKFGGRPSVYGKVKPMVLEMMHKNYKQQWTIRELSDQLGMGYYTVGRALRQLTFKGKVKCVRKSAGTMSSLWELCEHGML